MKKFILFPLAALLLCACTTEEQSQQIRLFWLKQYAAVMTQKLANMQPQANGQSLQALLTEFQKSPSVTQSSAAQNTPAADAQQRQKPAPQIMEVTLDTEALTRALQEGRIAGACLDVTDPEPLPSEHPLWEMDNVILTPHVSGLFELPETLEKILDICIENLECYLVKRPLRNVIDDGIPDLTGSGRSIMTGSGRSIGLAKAGKLWYDSCRLTAAEGLSAGAGTIQRKKRGRRYGK